MTHQRIKSSTLYSIGHEGTTMEVKFLCGTCGGAGKTKNGSLWPPLDQDCAKCGGAGHTGVYRYSNVPPGLHQQIVNAERPGKEFNLRMRGKAEFKMEKA